jgi:hypothetical protein
MQDSCRCFAQINADGKIVMTNRAIEIHDSWLESLTIEADQVILRPAQAGYKTL